MRKIIYATISAEFNDGVGQITANADMICINSPEKFRAGLLRAKAAVEFIHCSDVSQLRLHEIDEHLPFSAKREIARACKTLLSIKAPHGKRVWGVGITPSIHEMLTRKTHEIIDALHDQAHKAVHYYRQSSYSEMEFCRYVGHLVSAAIQVLPSTRSELTRLYTEIWLKREKDRSFPTNRSQKAKEAFHAKCMKMISELELDDPPIPIASPTWLVPSGLAEIQKMHWDLDILCAGKHSGKISSKTQQIAFKAFMSLQKMAEARNKNEVEQVYSAVFQIAEKVEISNYWLEILHTDFNTYQQITCHDWSRLEKINPAKVDALVQELSEVVRLGNTIELRLALLRLLLPLIESWILCILLERQLKKASITRHISTGLREFKEHLEFARPELLATFNKLKQFARPYGKRDTNGK